MKLNKLTLANFRAFDQIDIDFAHDVTVIAGVNGVGKSGVLKAVTTALSLALPKFTASTESSISFSETDVQIGKPGLIVSLALQLEDAALFVDISRSASLEGEKAETLLKRRDELRFATRETKKGSKEALKINDEIRLIDNLLGEKSDVGTVRLLPTDTSVDREEFATVLKGRIHHPQAVFYSTSRFLSRLPPILPKARDIDASAAYEKALDQLEVSLNDFANWYRVLSAGAQTKATSQLFQQLERAVQTFLPEVANLALHETRPPRFSVNKGNKKFFLEQLSDGERGLLALVFDLTRRLAIANPERDDPIANGVALVLIDEIELHLHPKWQRDVLTRLRDTFRSCQFIVTTHSPLVLGEVEARCVRFLDFHDNKVSVTTPSETYGMDANRILQELMGAPVRNRQINEDLKTLFTLIDGEHFDAARAAMVELESKLGSDEPELTRASSLIRFLEGSE